MYRQDSTKYTVDNYAIMKTGIPGIADQKKDIHKANKSNSPRPAIVIDKYFPGVYITVVYT